MKTLGIDLSSSQTRTAICVLDWNTAGFKIDEGQLRKGSAARPLDVDDLVELIRSADWVGIDAPFGWPEPFVEGVQNWRTNKRSDFGGADYERFRLRQTDLQDELKRHRPLSVSSDRIAVTAMKCVQVLGRAGIKDRTGWNKGSRVVEVYPAAALRQWGFESTGYKGSGGRSKLAALVDRVLGELGGICRLSDEQVGDLKTSDDRFDAFVAALVARVRERDKTSRPSKTSEKSAAPREGWMHVPLSSAGFPGCLK